MMVKETRIVFDLSDITAFKVRCSASSCGSEITASLENLSGLTACPVCREGWEDSRTQVSAVRETLRALRNLQRDPNPSRQIVFEIDGDDS